MKKGIQLLCILSILLGSACSNQLTRAPSADEMVIYPPPPDTTRIQYLTSFNSPEDLLGRPSSFKKFFLGHEEPTPIIKPFGMTTRGSMIYICDPGSGSIVILNLETRKSDHFSPGGLGRLKLPLACAVDDREFLFVADANRQQIVVFNEKGNFVHAFGEPENFRPTDIVIHEDQVLVANVKNHAIHVYDRLSYEPIRTIPSLEPGEDGFLAQPTHLCVAGQTVFVNDFGSFKIKNYDFEGHYLGSIGTYGEKPGQLVRPKGIAVDHQHNLYVVDAAFENTQIFNRNGNILMFFGGPYSSHGDMYLPADVAIDYSNTEFFEPYVNERFKLEYLIWVTNQYGPDKVNVYGFIKNAD
jgi:DNA-binding beta-propeller fold protein YncE